MKKISIAILLLFCAGAAFSQRQVPIVLNVYGGYTFPDHVPLGYYQNYNSYGHIDGAGQYGAGLEFFVDHTRSLELSYQYMGTKMRFYNYGGETNSGNDGCTIQYILIGGNNYVPTHGNVMPYGGVAIGVGLMNYTYYSINNTNYSENITKFAWNLHLGAKIKTESALSIKLQAYLQSIAQGVGVGVGFGTGGAGAGVTTYSSMLQFGLGAALCIALGGNKSGGQHPSQ